MSMLGGRPQAERVLSRRNHRQRNGGPTRLPMEYLEIQPLAQPRIVDLCLALPELRCQIALNIKMIQLQLDDIDVFREVAPHILCTYLQAGHFTSLALRLNQHLLPPYGAGYFWSKEPA